MGDTILFWCVKCVRSFASKQAFQEHFKVENTRSDGKYVQNKCLNSRIKEFATSKKEALSINQQMNKGGLSAFFPASKRPCLDNLKDETTMKDSSEESSSTIDDRDDIGFNDGVASNSGGPENLLDVQL